MGRNLGFLSGALLLCVLTLDARFGLPVDRDTATQIYGSCPSGECRLRRATATLPTCEVTVCWKDREMVDWGFGNTSYKELIDQKCDPDSGCTKKGYWVEPCQS